MNQKLLIVLFSTIFYNGVTCSVKEGFSDEKLSEGKPLPKVSSVTDETKKKVEPAPVVNSTDHLVSGIPNPILVSQPTEISTTQNGSIISNSSDKNIAVNSSVEIAKKKNQDSMIQSERKITDNKNSSQAVESKSATSSEVPAFENSSANYSATSLSKNASSTNASSTNASSSYSTVDPTATTPMKTTIIPTISTVTPTPALTTKVVMGQDTPALAEEKHFDGPSFIGGIVLTIGLTAIGFIAFKYYKSGKIDMNYRTL